MGYVNRTISYLQRNGFAKTKNAILERMDQKHMDPAQKRANAYVFEETVPDTAKRMDAAFDLCFSILVPSYETKSEYMKQMIESVLSQSYPNFELIIADASASATVKDTVSLYEDKRIRYLRLSQNGGISANTNEALRMACGDYIGLLDHDDLLTPNALMEMYDAICKGDYDFLYSDEDKVSADLSTYFEPNFKPDFNFDYFLCNNYICHFAVCRACIMKALLFRTEYDGAQDYDMFLRIVAQIEKNRPKEENAEPFALDELRKSICHIPKVLYHWRAHASSTADNPMSKRYAYEAGKKAIASFLKEAGYMASVSDSDHLGFYEIHYTPDLFRARRDICSVSFLTTKRGKVISGPVLDGCQQFVGMRASYSGYLHRAQTPFDIDAPAKNAKEIMNPYFDGRCKKGKRLFLPDESFL